MANVLKHPLLIGILASLCGGFVTWLFTGNEAPIADVSPQEVTVNAGEIVQFSAASSHDPEGDVLLYRWRLGAQDLDTPSPVGTCHHTSAPSLVNCRFFMSGIHALTLSVADSRGLARSMSARVTVARQDGYLGFVIDIGSSPGTRRLVALALLKGVDWPSVQALTNLPIVLYDPIAENITFAAYVARDIDEASQAVVEIGGGLEVRTVHFGLPDEAITLIRQNLGEIGIEFWAIPLPTVEFQTTGGYDDIGNRVVPLNAPQDLLKYYR